jgi:hypothetical protein
MLISNGKFAVSTRRQRHNTEMKINQEVKIWTQATTKERRVQTVAMRNVIHSE